MPTRRLQCVVHNFIATWFAWASVCTFGCVIWPDTRRRSRILWCRYGLQPGTGGAALPEGFRPALSWHTQVAQVKHLPKGHNVGYGNTYTVERAGNYALVPTGYGDGYRRGPHNYGRVLIGGARCPVLGRVSMEKILIGLWPAEENGAKVQTGDPVVLIGRQGDAEVSVEEVAHRAGTNNYEVCTAALPRGVRRTVNNPDGDGRVSRPYTPKA